ncbi:hypothetical protein ACQP3L_33930, partial [Escherichia coli]
IDVFPYNDLNFLGGCYVVTIFISESVYLELFFCLLIGPRSVDLVTLFKKRRKESPPNKSQK